MRLAQTLPFGFVEAKPLLTAAIGQKATFERNTLPPDSRLSVDHTDL
jgi:hypothetical protein